MYAILLVSKFVLAGIWMFVACVVGVVLFVVSLWFEVKHELNGNKKDVYVCVKHGPYPVEQALYYTFTQEGRPDVKVPRCPCCYKVEMNELTNMMGTKVAAHKVAKQKKVLEWRAKENVASTTPSVDIAARQN